MKTVVLIPKGYRYFHEIHFVDVLWKTVRGILNRCLTAAIQFHGTLHGFRTGRGTGTASLEAKLIHQMTLIREELLYKIFLDIHKAYDALDCVQCLDILAAYGIVPRSLRLLWSYWGCLFMVSRAGRYFMVSFQGQCGVTQVVTALPHYIQHGCGFGTTSLGLCGGVGVGRSRSRKFW